MKIAIIGAGLSGLACAEKLVAAGNEVCLFDKARGPGGRMSTRRVDTPLGQVSFDHGAQYFTAEDKAFKTIVDDWENSGAVARWPAAGADAWIGIPAMNAPIKAMAARHDITWFARIDGLHQDEKGWQLQSDNESITGIFDTVVLAIPAEQAAKVLALVDQSFAAIAANIVSDPCWTVMLAFAEPLDTAEVILRDDAAIGWAARNSNKPGRTGQDSWVIQASPKWSEEHLEEDQSQVISLLSERFAELLHIPLPEPLAISAHRWRYARSGRSDVRALYNRDLNIGVCGDWMLGPRVECAWLSGAALGQMIII